MYLNRLEFELELHATSKISLYSDEIKITGRDEVNVRLLVRNNNDDLIIPASSFKGAWRASIGKDISDVFGHAKGDANSVGVMGRLQLSDAVAQGEVIVEERTRTTIDRHKRTAERNKLFGESYAPAGTVFKLQGLLFYAATSTNEDAVNELSQLLTPIYEYGITLGSGAKLGQGKIAIHSAPKIKYREFNTHNGDFPEKPEVYKGGIKAPPGKSLTHAATLKIELGSDTPFHIIGESQSSQDGETILPLMDGDGPALPQSSIYGALRSKCEWIEACNTLKVGEDDLANKNHDHLPKGEAISNAEISKLTSIERLFGVSGFKGLLECHTVRRESAGASVSLQNVAIDRFTGGALDGALFSTKAFMDTQWLVELTISSQRADAVYGCLDDGFFQLDHAVLQRLSEALNSDVLFLGHGAAKGLGWFEAKSTLTLDFDKWEQL